MKFGLTESDYRFITRQLQPLVDVGADIWCFGSRARGDYSEFSDLDLMIECGQDLRRMINDISELFVESRLPIKVELIQKKTFLTVIYRALTLKKSLSIKLVRVIYRYLGLQGR